MTTTMQLPPGSTIDGKYTVASTLHARPGATTYEAHALPGQPLAVTLYDGECFPSALMLERCLRELRQLQKVQHPAVVPVLDLGRSGDGLYEVQPIFGGTSFGASLQKGPLALERASQVVARVAEALLEAQRVGISHRNLGADTIFIEGDRVKVVGFAVGEPHAAGSYGPLLTIAPEQVEGKAIDQRTLIYNLACLMHWMLTGTPLFEGAPDEVLRAHREGELPSQVHPLLRRALSKDPRMRPMILKNFATELAELGGAKVQEPPRAQPDSPISTPTTRGWTMFTQAADTPKPVSPTPSAATSNAPGRGWTMFMEAADDGPAEAGSRPKAEPPTTSPAQPSSRGWTMFGDETGTGGSPPSTGPTSGAAPSAEIPPPPPHAGSQTPQPSSRGWTMFMGPAPESAPPAPAPAPPPASPPSSAEAKTAPGWTLFESAQSRTSGGNDQQTKPGHRAGTMLMAGGPPPTVDSPSHSEPLSADEQHDQIPGELPIAQPTSRRGQKRGWTMFMEAPLPSEPAEDERDTFRASGDMVVHDAPQHRHHEVSTAEVSAPARFPGGTVAVNPKKTVIAQHRLAPPPEAEPLPSATAPPTARPVALPRPVVEAGSSEVTHTRPAPPSRRSDPPYRAPRPSRLPLVIGIVLGSAVVLGGAVWFALSATF